MKESIDNAIFSSNVYLTALSNYTNLVNNSYNDPESQRKIYDAYVIAEYYGHALNSMISNLSNNITSDVQIPVQYLDSTIGIGIPGLNVLYYSATASGYSNNPFVFTKNKETKETFLHFNVGGLPDGTMIFTGLETYTITNGQPVLLGAVENVFDTQIHNQQFLVDHGFYKRTDNVTQVG